MRVNSALYAVVVSLVIVGAVAVREPALRATLFADDWDHYAIEQGIYPVALPIWDMFNWVPRHDHEHQALLRKGRLPWWAARNLHLSVFRPLASVLTHFDFAVLDGPNHVARMHIHSLLWWLALVVGVAALLGQLLPLPIAALSVAIYAFDDGHIVPFAWPANRSELIAFAFIVWAICAQLVGERTGSRVMRGLAVALVILGLAAGEHALAPLTYLVAFYLRPSSISWSRARRLVPFVGLVVGYALIRWYTGYGIAGSGFYVDPLSEPMRYARACLTRIPILLGELVFSASSEWWYWGYPWAQEEWYRSVVPRVLRTQPAVRVEMLTLGSLALLLSLLAVRQLGRIPWRGGERELQWLLVGALASLIPLAATLALGRMTLAPAIAFNSLLAYVTWRAGTAALETGRPWSRVGYASLTLLLIHLTLVVPALRSRAGAQYMYGATYQERREVESADYGVPSLAGKHVFLLSARGWVSQFLIPYVLHAAGRAMPSTANLLSPVHETRQLLTRIDETSFELEYPNHPTVLEPFNGSVYRSETNPLLAGAKVTSELFEVTVLAVQNGQPSRLRFVFSRSVEDRDFVFMIASENGLTRITMPPIGARVWIPVVRVP